MIFNLSNTIFGGGTSGLEYEEGEWTPSEDIARPTINFTRTHSTTPIFCGIVDTTDTVTTANSIMAFSYFDFYRLSDLGVKRTETSIIYALPSTLSKSSSAVNGYSGTNVYYNSDNSGTTNNQYSRYFVTESAFYPNRASTYYFRAGRTYKWIAIWR